jgi:hypothetical protein
MDDQRKCEAEEQAALVGAAMGESMRSVASDTMMKIKLG